MIQEVSWNIDTNAWYLLQNIFVNNVWCFDTHNINFISNQLKTFTTLNTYFFLAVIFVTKMKFTILFINSWAPENNANWIHGKTTTNLQAETSANIQLLFCQHANNSYFNNTIHIFCCYKEQNTFKKILHFHKIHISNLVEGIIGITPPCLWLPVRTIKERDIKPLSLSRSIKNRMQ